VPGAAVYNVCTGRPTSILDLARLIGDLSGRAPDRRNGPPRAGDIRASLGNPERARRDLGIAAGTAVRDGLAALIKVVQRERRATVTAG
jgi:UDP-glucose 4-epimerase